MDGHASPNIQPPIGCMHGGNMPQLASRGDPIWTNGRMAPGLVGSAVAARASWVADPAAEAPRGVLRVALHLSADMGRFLGTGCCTGPPTSLGGCAKVSIHSATVDLTITWPDLIMNGLDCSTLALARQRHELDAEWKIHEVK